GGSSSRDIRTSRNDIRNMCRSRSSKRLHKAPSVKGHGSVSRNLSCIMTSSLSSAGKPKKIHAEHEAEFARQQEELAQKPQAERVASPTEHGPGLSDQRQWEMDDAQLIYTEADWVELLAKIATNSALSKRELAEQSRVKPMTKTQQMDYIKDFVKNNSTLVYNQGWTMKKVPASVPAALMFAADASVSAATSSEVPAVESCPADTPTASAHVSVKHFVAAST
nr:hypothetical protein [Tanacetum cinerariifolium]